MKSIFLSILIFIGVFLVAGSNILFIIGQDWFHYLSYAMFGCVMIGGIYVTLIRKSKALSSMEPEQEDFRNVELRQEEDNNEK